MRETGDRTITLQFSLGKLASFFFLFLRLENATFPSSEMREMVEGLRNRVNSLVLELKEKHHRQKQDFLALKKNDRKERYKQMEDDSEFSRQCRRDSLDNDDLSTGIVIRKEIFENDMDKNVKRKLSLNVVHEKDC